MIYRSLSCLLVVVPALAQPAMPPASVTVAPVVERAIDRGLAFIGTVAPRRASVVGAEVAGRVVEVVKREGAFVQADEVVARLDSRSAEIARLVAVAEHAAAVAEHAAVVAERAQAASMVGELDTRDEMKQQALAKCDAARAMAAYWEFRFKNSEKLRAKSTISEEEHALTTASYKEAVANAMAAEQACKMAVEGERPAMRARMDQAVAEQDARVAQWAATVEARAQRVKHAERELAKHAVRAPFAGVVVVRHAEEGQWVVPGAPVVEVTDLATVEVVVAVGEAHVGRVLAPTAGKPGMLASIELDAVPGERFDGTVAAVVPMADARTRTFPVRIAVANRGWPEAPVLKAGMFARATLAVGATASALLVSKDAIVVGPQGRFVYVVTPGVGGAPAQARPVTVALGAAVGGLFEVAGALSAGDLVVVRGNERLRPGQPVVVTETIEAGVEPVAAPRGQ